MTLEDLRHAGEERKEMRRHLKELNAVVDTLVESALATGATWSEIGEALGVSKATVHKTFQRSRR